MKIYSIKDIMLEYFQTPFCAENTNEVMASLSNLVNRIGENHVYAQAPHHYQLWQVGLFTDDGHLSPEREHICDLNSLIRSDLRTREPEPGRDPETRRPPQLSQGPIGKTLG